MSDDQREVRWELLVSAAGEGRGEPIASGFLLAHEATQERAREIFQEAGGARGVAGGIRFVEQDGKEILRFTIFDHRRERKCEALRRGGGSLNRA